MERARRGSACLAALLVVAAALAWPGGAGAGQGLRPNGETIDVRADAAGAISSPQTIDLIVSLDAQDADAAVWVSDSPQIGGDGRPAGAQLGSCRQSALRPLSEPGAYACGVATSSLRAGRTYYWWLRFDRLEPGGATATASTSGPFAFTLVRQSAIPPVSTKTYESAGRLPSGERYTGKRSIKHTRLTRMLYGTMRTVARPRTLAVACWSPADYEAVASDLAIETSGPDSDVVGFWLRAQPRWLHLSPFACRQMEDLYRTRQPTGIRAFALTIVLHEGLHAYGVTNEAQTNCYAVQLVPVAARLMGFTPRKADYLRVLALSKTRAVSPHGYWDAAACRDGGRWDLRPDAANLR